MKKVYALLFSYKTRFLLWKHTWSNSVDSGHTVQGQSDQGPHFLPFQFV